MSNSLLTLKPTEMSTTLIPVEAPMQTIEKKIIFLDQPLQTLKLLFTKQIEEHDNLFNQEKSCDTIIAKATQLETQVETRVATPIEDLQNIASQMVDEIINETVKKHLETRIQQSLSIDIDLVNQCIDKEYPECPPIRRFSCSETPDS